MLTGSWRSRKRLSVAGIAFAIVIILTTIANLHYRSSYSLVNLRIPYQKGSDQTEQICRHLLSLLTFPAHTDLRHLWNPSANYIKAGNATLLKQLAPSYIKAILNPKDKKFDRLQCPKPTPKRYDYLRVDHTDSKTDGGQIRYFFALNLRQCIGILPRLIGSIVETVRFLGPENCALSIVEGNSDDGTLEILGALDKDMKSLGLEYFLQTSGINPKNGGDRIEALAALRNLALEPLINNASHFAPDTAVIFLNDVAICMDDILELVHQHAFQEADMVCAMDWSDINPAPVFYDIWIARAINGDTFWEIPADGGWRFASNLFWNHPASRQRYDEHKVFQVFACWNGAVVFGAKPILKNKIRFRRSRPDECYAGEPRLLCKDLWMEGYSKIAVVPSVNLEYSDKSAKKVKGLHGYVFEAVKGEDANNGSLRIVWDNKPPDKVKCMANFEDQSWVPWNQGFEPRQLNGT